MVRKKQKLNDGTLLYDLTEHSKIDYATNHKCLSCKKKADYVLFNGTYICKKCYGDSEKWMKN